MAAGIEYKLIAVIALGFLTNESECAETPRLCGKELADALALVCQGRGYNVAFKPQDAASSTAAKKGRYKRGIVDECCRRVCTLSTLESYCSEAMPTKKDTLQISKRSELSSSEMQTTVPMGGRQFDNSIRSSKYRKLRPLVFLYSNRYRTEDPGSKRPFNISINSVKNSKSPAANVKPENHQLKRILNGYNSENPEIMAEVVESSRDSNIRRKRHLFSKIIQV